MEYCRGQISGRVPTQKVYKYHIISSRRKKSPIIFNTTRSLFANLKSQLNTYHKILILPLKPYSIYSTTTSFNCTSWILFLRNYQPCPLSTARMLTKGWLLGTHTMLHYYKFLLTFLFDNFFWYDGGKPIYFN